MQLWRCNQSSIYGTLNSYNTCTNIEELSPLTYHSAVPASLVNQLSWYPVCKPNLFFRLVQAQFEVCRHGLKAAPQPQVLNDLLIRDDVLVQGTQGEDAAMVRKRYSA